MADTPTLDQNMLNQLVDMGALTPETASKFTPAAPMIPESIAAAPEMLIPNSGPYQPDLAAVPETLTPNTTAQMPTQGQGLDKNADGFIDNLELSQGPATIDFKLAEAQKAKDADIYKAEQAQLAQNQEKIKLEQEAAKAIEYNKLASEQNLPLIPVPKVPETTSSAPLSPVVAEKAIEPTAQEIEVAAAPIRKQRSQEAVVQQDLMQQQQKQQQNERAAEQKVAKYSERTLSEIFKDGSIGEKIGAALSIFASAAGQGLLRSNSNSALDYFDGVLKRRQEEKKMRADEAAAEQEAAWKKIELDMKQRVANSDVLKNNAQIQEIFGKIGEKQTEARQKQLSALMLQSGQITDPSVLDEKQAERAVRLPDGTYRLAPNKFLAEALAKSRDEVEPAIDGIKRVKEYARDANRLSLQDRAVVGAEIQALVGQLRLPLVGPGALTDKEYERIQSTIGDPNAIFALKDVELKKLDTILNKMQKDLKSKYIRSGIDLPQTREERIVEGLQQKGYNTKDIQKAIEKIR